jgi:starch synthase
VYVVMVAPECAPAVKTGGLGDVVFGLSRELELRGHAVDVIVPRYAGLRSSEIRDFQESYRDLWVPWFGRALRCTVWSGRANGRRCFFIEPHSASNFFGRDRLYGYADDTERFAFFSKAALEFMLRADKRPDIIHCHDWHTGLVPVLRREQYGEAMPRQRVCYTVHNFRHQGTGDEQVLWATQLGKPHYFLDADRLGDDFRYRALNPLKGGVVYSDFVTTVSPSHADEALYDDGACGLGRTLKEHQAKFRGILNGVDYEVWDPGTDPFLAAHYSASTMERKYTNRQAVRDRFWLRKRHSPVVAYVGRLDDQKGMHLVHHALFYTRDYGGQFVLIGDAHHDDRIRDHFLQLKNHLNDDPDCHIEIGYREDLAHLIYAGADLLVAPSLFEPCGLAPMIAMRYGTVPVVRATGGMTDTIVDYDHSQRPLAQRNGFVFHHTDNQAVESALGRALRLWYRRPGSFREIVANCLSADHSWTGPGQDYLDIYQQIKHN